MRKTAQLILGFMIVSTLFFACVPARQVEELKEKYEKCDSERESYSAENRKMETQNNELQANIEKLDKRIKALKSDTTVMGTSLRKMQRQYDKINKLNDELLKKQSELQKGSEAENRKLLLELQQMQKNLQEKEDALKELEKELDRKKKNLDQLSAELKEREKRVNELEEMIAQKDQAVKNLKNKIAEALLGFKDRGLTIEQKNGKIYVSLEAKLLFDKGSTAVGKEGKKALVDLAKAIEGQDDMQVLVEGHTDTDKLSGTGCLKDNWDLSVMRATSVVRIMLENSEMDPTKLIAGGRGPYLPVDPADTEEAKAKNRRIEIILTPNLDKLFEIIGTPED